MYGCAGRGPAWSLTHLLPYSIAKPKAYSVPNAERTDVPSRLPVVFVRHFGLVREISTKESVASFAVTERRCHSFRFAGRRSAEGNSMELVSYVNRHVIMCRILTGIALSHEIQYLISEWRKRPGSPPSLPSLK